MWILPISRVLLLERGHVKDSVDILESAEIFVDKLVSNMFQRDKRSEIGGSG